MAKEDKQKPMKSLADLAKRMPTSDTPPAEAAHAGEIWTQEDEQAFGEFCSLAGIAKGSEVAARLKHHMDGAYYFYDDVIRIEHILSGKGVRIAGTTGPIKTFFDRTGEHRKELGSEAHLAYVRRDLARDPFLKSLPAEEMSRIIGFPLTHRHATQFFIHLRKAQESKEGFEELMSFLRRTKNWNFNRTKSPLKETLDAWRKRYGIPIQE